MPGDEANRNDLAILFGTQMGDTDLEVCRPRTMPIAVSAKAMARATNVSVFGQIKFEVPGVYFVEVLVDDVMKLRFPLPLAVVPPPNQATTAPGESPTMTK